MASAGEPFAGKDDNAKSSISNQPLRNKVSASSRAKLDRRKSMVLTPETKLMAAVIRCYIVVLQRMRSQWLESRQQCLLRYNPRLVPSALKVNQKNNDVTSPQY
jgi:hypothetical protein